MPDWILIPDWVGLLGLISLVFLAILTLRNRRQVRRDAMDPVLDVIDEVTRLRQENIDLRALNAQLQARLDALSDKMKTDESATCDGEDTDTSDDDTGRDRLREREYQALIRLRLDPDQHHDPATIRNAFSRLARETHPDHGGDADDFRSILAARDFLVAHHPVT